MKSFMKSLIIKTFVSLSIVVVSAIVLFLTISTTGILFVLLVPLLSAWSIYMFFIWVDSWVLNHDEREEW